MALDKQIEIPEWVTKHPFLTLSSVGVTISYLCLTAACFNYFKLLAAGTFFGVLTVLYAWALYGVKFVAEEYDREHGRR